MLQHRVLIVEDEVLIGLVLEDILEALDCTVAANEASLDGAAEALDRLGPGGFDVAVLDVNLGPDLVFPLADRVAALGKSIAFATGSHPGTIPERFAGCAVLPKPYALADVEAALQSLSASQ